VAGAIACPLVYGLDHTGNIRWSEKGVHVRKAHLERARVIHKAPHDE